MWVPLRGDPDYSRRRAESMTASYESLLNGRLAELLVAQGSDARGEYTQPGSRRRLDVEVTIGRLVVALEAETDSESGALEDANARMAQAAVGEVRCDAAVAVNYPPDLLVESFSQDTVFGWAVWPSRVFESGNAAHLSAVLGGIREDSGDPVRLAEVLDVALSQAVGGLSVSQRQALAEAVNLPTEQKVRGRVRDTTPAAAKRAMLVIAAAGMFHTRLDGEIPARPERDANTVTSSNPNGDPYVGGWPPPKLQHCIGTFDAVDALRDAWRMILAVDYRPVFESARRVLYAPAQDHCWQNAVRGVARASLTVSRDAASARHDLLGRIFHMLLDTARYDGSFYTSTSAAVLLAGLAIRECDIPSDLPQTDFKIVDPACGTGTLLMAAAERIRDLRGPDHTGTDAAALIEKIMWGFDVNTTACHMAATTLGLLSPSTAFRNMNVHMMPLGVTGGDARVGSLEMLDRRAVRVDWSRDGAQTSFGFVDASGEQVDAGAVAEVLPNQFDLVIMNPPYTRDSLRHDQFSKTVERRLKAREKSLMQGRHGHGSSAGTMFMDLGEHLCKLSDGAALAVVLPLTGAANPSGSKVRQMLAEQFHIEWVVCSHDPNRPWFSENTSISEMLVVARRHSNEPTHTLPTKFVCLKRNSLLVTDAASAAAALRDGTLDELVGTVTEWPAERMALGDWRPLGLTSEHLVYLVERVRDGDMFAVELLGTAARVGPEGRRIRDAFTKSATADSAGRRGLWHNDTEATRSLRANTDTYIHAKPAKEHLADSYWQQRSRLLLCAKPWLITARVTAVLTDEQTVGSMWVPVNYGLGIPARQWEKAMVVWLNSTLGLVSVIAEASPTKLSRPALSIAAMRRLSVPKLNTEQASAMAGIFDALADTELTQLRDACTDSARVAIDNAVADILGASRETITGARRELAVEPSVNG